uniref:Uncharacterized protein n=1 Tax=Anguilla anguilla TaxID=7936 RepID=A0A0E9TPC6_ANGAN
MHNASVFKGRRSPRARSHSGERV